MPTIIPTTFKVKKIALGTRALTCRSTLCIEMQLNTKVTGAPYRDTISTIPQNE
ncbi:hypothetical protein DES53_113115 [Roseimicrobium gellanilyticum]|uniref:Uncharacterized protein n=1 Tax=Roseimicrobium gellanilyticum TaxID=748857 RepID=A0A366H6V1_9BACT|nr:hypothetical protein DES53_113115 [Roseimicrobium gellanilyticum]